MIYKLTWWGEIIFALIFMYIGAWMGYYFELYREKKGEMD